MRFNPPPNWPPPPPGWAPGPGWQPDPSWPPPPVGWQLWTYEPEVTPPGPRPDESRPDVVVGALRALANRPRWMPLVGIVVLVLLRNSVVAGLTACAGLAGLVLGVIAMVKGDVEWARVSTRRSGLMLSGMSVAGLIAAGLSSPTDLPAAETASTSKPAAAVATTPSPTPSPSSATPTPTVEPVEDLVTSAETGSALAALGRLEVKGRAPRSGYSRDEFGPAWRDIDRNGCDQRNDVLRRDLDVSLLKANTHGCVVLKGTLDDPYTGDTITFDKQDDAAAVQIDHVVALADAWVKGASGWSATKRSSFANDPLNLRAAGAAANESKGDGDAATWLPRRKAFRCTYVADQVAVKVKYDLWVTPAERQAAAHVLSRCSGRRLPRSSVIPLGGAPVQKPPKPRPTSEERGGSSNVASGVWPGSFCSTEGQLGRTAKGTLMTCSYKAGDSRLRWRAA